MKDLRCLFGFHIWEELPLSESRGNLISLSEEMIQNAELGDMKIRTCARCGDQHRGDASRVEMRVITSAFRPSPGVKDAEEVKGLNRVKEIIRLAYKLKWVYPPNKNSYPLMQLSEVEKCMLAMYNDFDLNRMRKWVEETQSSEQDKEAED